MNERKQAVRGDRRRGEPQRAGGASERRTGPRGGTTTRSKSGMVKKNLWIAVDVAEVLRQKAFDERRSEADIIREGLERLLGGE